MRLIFLIFLFGSSKVFAASCYFSDEMLAEYNAKYAEKLTIKVKENDSKYLVNIELPKTINGKDFNFVWLVSDSVDSPSFSAQLATFEGDNEYWAWYEIDAAMIRRHIFLASYGETVNDCPFNLSKEVFYN